MSKVVVKKAVRPAGHVAPLPAKKKTTDPTVRTYRALAPLRVADEGGETTHMRQFGDFVPEADKWKNVGLYLRTQQIEICFVNQSELDAWREEYAERTAAEDEEASDQKKRDAEMADLRKRMSELEKQNIDALKPKDFNEGQNGGRGFQPDPTVEQRIDFGGVKRTDERGMPQPVKLPSVPTREVPQQHNVADNRTRPNSTRRVLKKKG